MAGGGVKGGIVPLNRRDRFHATENRHYVTDVHATIMHQLGLDFAQTGNPGPERAWMWITGM